MTVQELGHVLAANGYPGRGVVWARTLDGRTVAAYFLTARTPASQARELRLGRDELAVRTTTAPLPHRWGPGPSRRVWGGRAEVGRSLFHGWLSPRACASDRRNSRP